MLIAVFIPGTLSASSDTHNLHIFLSLFFFSCVPVWHFLDRAKQKTKGEEKRGLNSSHLAILSLAHTPEHYTNMVKHNNEIPHQHFKKDWQGYVILSFYAASIIRVLENARRNALFFSLFALRAQTYEFSSVLLLQELLAIFRANMVQPSRSQEIP